MYINKPQLDPVQYCFELQSQMLFKHCLNSKDCEKGFCHAFRSKEMNSMSYMCNGN